MRETSVRRYGFQQLGTRRQGRRRKEGKRRGVGRVGKVRVVEEEIEAAG